MRMNNAFEHCFWTFGPYLKQIISFGPFFLFWIFFPVRAFFSLGLNEKSRANTALLLALVLYTSMHQIRCFFVFVFCCLGLFYFGGFIEIRIQWKIEGRRSSFPCFRMLSHENFSICPLNFAPDYAKYIQHIVLDIQVRSMGTLTNVCFQLFSGG